MSVESCPGSQQAFGSLQGCLVEGDSEQRARERRIRRRSLAISIILQTVALVLVVLVPLFGKTERLTPSFVPIPPYYHSSGPAHPETRPIPPRRRHFTPVCTDCAPTYIPERPPTPGDNQPPEIGDSVPGGGTGPQIPGAIAINDARPQPERPAEMRPRVPRRIVVTHIEPAMLIHRVEPSYPPLAIQIRREGHVELHAIIATDGSIQALQAVGGDALFYQSALEAVRQWRYRPTILNDQPVEIDTFITVIYTMRR
jgi:periplasmic protein TonB